MKVPRFSLYVFLAVVCQSMLPNISAAQQQEEYEESTTPPLSEAELMMLEYRFDDAMDNLDAEIKKLQRKRQSVDNLELLREEAEKGARFLSSTRNVVFVDSMVLPKEQFLTAYVLSSDAGTLLPSADFLARNAVPGLYGSAGATLFCSELGDVAYFARMGEGGGSSKLAMSYRYADSWSAPEYLPSLSSCEGEQDYPFVLGDGVTLYYASTDPEGLGGYDIWKSRFNAASGQWVEPENLGMPFNSPANDYLYVEDENTGVGYFATDRRQPTGYVCVYTFLLADEHEYLPADEDRTRRAALVWAISESQSGHEQDVARVRAALAALTASRVETASSAEHVTYFEIDENTVYTSLSQFRNSQARAAAEQWLAKQEDLETLLASLAIMRADYGTPGHANAALKAQILQMEQQELTLRQQIRDLGNNMRRLETRR